MPFEGLLTKAMEEFGTFGLISVALVLVLLLVTVGVMRFFGLSLIGDRSKVVDPERLDKMFSAIETMNQQLEERFQSLERRMNAAENGLNDRPTKQELHEMQLAFARWEGRYEVLESSIKAVTASQTRMEDFLLRISERERAK